MRKTNQEIDVEIVALRAIRDRLHDRNHGMINIQIRALNERMSLDEIYDEWESGDLDNLTAALDALNWRQGETETVPSEEWKELLS